MRTVYGAWYKDMIQILLLDVFLLRFCFPAQPPFVQIFFRVLAERLLCLIRFCFIGVFLACMKNREALSISICNTYLEMKGLCDITCEMIPVTQRVVDKFRVRSLVCSSAGRDKTTNIPRCNFASAPFTHAGEKEEEKTWNCSIWNFCHFDSTKSIFQTKKKDSTKSIHHPYYTFIKDCKVAHENLKDAHGPSFLLFALCPPPAEVFTC